MHNQDWPSTVGFVRPIVVLPASLAQVLSPAATKQVSRHELSHARWRDPLVNAFVRMMRALLWPCLPLWLLERVIAAEREAAADKAAIEESAPAFERTTIVSDYAMTLVTMARPCAQRKVPRLYHVAATHIGPARLEERVRRLFDSSQPLSRIRLALAALVLFVAVTGLAWIPLTSQQLDPQAQAEQRRLNIERRLPGFTKSPAAQQSTAAMNALIVALKNRDWRVDAEVRAALDQIRSAGVIDPLVITLAADKDWRVREKVAWAMGQLNDRRAVEPLIVALQDGAGEVKHTAAWSLGMIGDKRATEALIANLKDGNFEARHGAAWALGRMRDTQAIVPLIGLLGDRFADVRHGAAWALGEIGDKRAIDPLTVALQESDPDVRGGKRGTGKNISSVIGLFAVGGV
jgi:hypothetical protein